MRTIATPRPSDFWSYQLLNQNKNYGYDLPMAYGEVFIPWVADGMLIRVGRFISIPDIEAQLAPNNYMYTHSMTYTFDNYTNTGIQTSTALNKNWILQARPLGRQRHAAVACRRDDAEPVPESALSRSDDAEGSRCGSEHHGWRALDQRFDGKDDINVVADAINGGQWGYNNLQWYGLTYYHKFNDQWHIAFETYDLHQNNVPNALNPAVTGPAGLWTLGGTPFSPQYMPFNAPGLAQCSSTTVLSCTAEVRTA